MTVLILQGGNLSTSTADASAAIDAAYTVRQSIVHAHFPMFNGTNADGSWKPLPMWHPTQPSTPYFPLAVADALWKRGQLLLMTWGTQNLNTGGAGTRKRMEPADILAGRFDSYFHTAAAAIAAWKHPIVIALNAEFNGTWSTWYMEPADFTVVWRYIVDLFRRDGATNIAWAWTANQVAPSGTNQTTAQDRLALYWPGPEWVDFTGFDAYNWAGSRSATWLTFEQVITGSGVNWLGNTYGTIATLAPDKPMMIGEFGCHSAPGDKAAWIRDALAVIPAKFPLIAIASYYGIDDGASLWSLKQTDGTVQAWSDGVLRGPYVRGSEFQMPPDLQPLRTFASTVRVEPERPDVPAQVHQVALDALEEMLGERDTLEKLSVALTTERDQARGEAVAAQNRTDQLRAAIRTWSAARDALMQLGQ